MPNRSRSFSIPAFWRGCLFGILAGGALAPGAGARTVVRIMGVEADGLIQTLPEPSARSVQPLRMSAGMRDITLFFSEDAPSNAPLSRLRFRLSGQDASWQDLTPVRGMNVGLLFFDADEQEVAHESTFLTGESPGWRGAPENSDFVQLDMEAIVPENAVTVRVLVSSTGGDIGIGIVAVDAMRLLVQSPGGNGRRDVDLGIHAGDQLDRPIGSPDNWKRDGSKPGMARLSILPASQPRPMLVLIDTDPGAHAAWTSMPIPVRPGDPLRMEWKAAYSVGSAGPGSTVYPRLDPGTYWFRAVAARTDGSLIGAEATLRVIILAPLYQRAGFWLAVAVLGSVAAGGVARIITRRRMQRKIDDIERRDALERERARIARDLHDDIGAGLTEIAMQGARIRRAIAGGSPEDAIRRVDLVCRSAIDLTRSVDEIVWAVNPANDTLDRFANYTMHFAAQFLDAAGLHARFDVPAAPMPVPLPGRVRHALFMAVREALNNAAKHAGAQTVHVGLRVENDQLHVVIADDGRGFEPAGDLGAGLHEGIESMNRRMNEIGGTVILTSRPGEGSQVEFRLAVAGDGNGGRA